MSRNRNHKCRVPGRAAPYKGMPHVREADPPDGRLLAINPFSWTTRKRPVICHLTGELTSEEIVELRVGLARDEERLEGAVLWAVQHGDPALYPSPGKVSELVWALNAYSLPFRRGRWLSVWLGDDCPDEHAVVLWDNHRRPVAPPDDVRRCVCGLPVALTGTDVFCASGHPIDAAVGLG